MSGELRVAEQKIAHRNELTGDVLERRLVAEVRKNARELVSLKFKWRGDSYLVIIERETTDGKLEVAFCNGKTMASATRTVYSLEVQGKLNWRSPRRFT